jgi:hypothetical protein
MSPKPSATIMHISKQLRDEAAEIYYGKNIFQVNGEMLNSWAHASWPGILWPRFFAAGHKALIKHLCLRDIWFVIDREHLEDLRDAIVVRRGVIRLAVRSDFWPEWYNRV